MNLREETIHGDSIAFFKRRVSIDELERCVKIALRHVEKRMNDQNRRNLIAVNFQRFANMVVGVITDLLYEKIFPIEQKFENQDKIHVDIKEFLHDKLLDNMFDYYQNNIKRNHNKGRIHETENDLKGGVAVIEVLIPMSFMNEKYRFQSVPYWKTLEDKIYINKGSAGQKTISTDNIRVLKVFDGQEKERIENYLNQLRGKESGEKWIKCYNCNKKFTQTIYKGKKSLPVCPYCGTHN